MIRGKTDFVWYLKYHFYRIWVKLDCPPVAHWDIVITFAAEVQFEFQDQIRKPRLKLHGAMFFKNCEN